MRIPRNSQPASLVIARGAKFEADLSIRDGRSTPVNAPAGLRLKVFVTRGKLDRRIAAGHRYEASPALALRVRQLTDPRTRRKIAGELRGVVDYVDNREAAPVISAVVIEPGAVRAGREAILGLAERLEASAPVSARGMVFARALVTDGTSPLYNPYSELTVSEAVFDVQDALGAHPTIGYDVIAA